MHSVKHRKNCSSGFQQHHLTLAWNRHIGKCCSGILDRLQLKELVIVISYISFRNSMYGDGSTVPKKAEMTRGSVGAASQGLCDNVLQLLLIPPVSRQLSRRAGRSHICQHHASPGEPDTARSD